jgi:hypothetical protein
MEFRKGVIVRFSCKQRAPIPEVSERVLIVELHATTGQRDGLVQSPLIGLYPPKEQQELVSIVEKTKSDIVQACR